MKLNDIYSSIVSDYLKMNEIKELEKYKSGIKELRNSYKSNVCTPLYQSQNNRDCYMLAYFPYYCILTNEVTKKVDKYIEDDNLVVSIYGCGPAPEVLGVVNQLHRKNIKFNLFDYEHGWENQRQFVKNYVRNKFNVNAVFREISGCDLLAICEDCKEGKSKCKKYIKATDVFIMQNCLNHITNKEDFQSKILSIIDKSKTGAIFMFIDLNYNISKDLINNILIDTRDKCELISQGNYERIRVQKEDIPKDIKDYIFTGEEDLILKTSINYSHIIIRKI